MAADNRVLARFRLENIRPAPRGVPQIEVTFDIDANGILHVSAKDKDTGAEQKVTISETSNLDQSEIERMVADAEAHRGEDSRLRELVDARNALDAAAYQVEKLLSDRGEAVAQHDRARAEMLVGDAREALKNQETPLERLRSLTGELQQVAQALSVSPAPQPQGASAGATGGGSSDDDGGDDVIDAEFTTS
jgi:molecular chaperone DnaK